MLMIPDVMMKSNEPQMYAVRDFKITVLSRNLRLRLNVE